MNVADAIRTDEERREREARELEAAEALRLENARKTEATIKAQVRRTREQRVERTAKLVAALETCRDVLAALSPEERGTDGDPLTHQIGDVLTTARKRLARQREEMS